ncbi:MAG: hypothetical protein ACT4O0_03390 [Pseudonocardia sp.]|jgi:hypothetical protein
MTDWLLAILVRSIVSVPAGVAGMPLGRFVLAGRRRRAGRKASRVG